MTRSPLTSQRSDSKVLPRMPYIRPSSSSREIQKRSASCGPSIGTPNSSARILAEPQWSIWPWVSSSFSMVTPWAWAAALRRSRSPPGSVKAPFIVRVHQMRQLFCCSGVTGMIATLSGGVDMARTWRGERSDTSAGAPVRAWPMRWLSLAFCLALAGCAFGGGGIGPFVPAPARVAEADLEVPYVPTPRRVVTVMLDLAEVGPEDH